MSFSVVQSFATSGDGFTGTSVNLSVTGLTAGNLLVAWVKGEGGASNPTNLAISDGTSSFTCRSLNARGTASPWGYFGYLLSANGGNKTITASWTTSQSFCRIRIAEISYAAGSLPFFDTDNVTANNNTANLATGQITTSASVNTIVLAGSGEFAALSLSNLLIGGVSRDGTISGSGNDAHCALWWKSFSSQQTNITGSATSAAGDWVASIIAFKEIPQGIAVPWIRV